MVAGLPKNVVQRYFFHFRVPLRYSDVERLLDILKTPEYDVSQFPKRHSAHNLVLIKRALEDCRRNEGIMTRAGAEAETSLLEAAAEMGDSTAIALLCGSRMRQSDVSPEDMESGSDLLTQLMNAKFPLAFKVSGDLAYTMGRPQESAKFYHRALEMGLGDNRLEVECLRNLGIFAFQQSRLMEARDYFSQACSRAEDPKQVLDCHFFLAQLREPDRVAVRRHLEAAATYGFNDAFLPLGSLLLNWYSEPVVAREWFKLAAATDRTGAALIGLLDAAVRLEEWEYADSVIARIRGLGDEVGANLLNARKTSIEQVQNHVVKKVVQTDQTRSGRFNL